MMVRLVIFPLSIYVVSIGNVLLVRSVGHALPVGEVVYDIMLCSVFGWYIYSAQRRAYHSGRTAALARTLALVVLWIPILVIFKFVLFFATLYWIS